MTQYPTDLTEKQWQVYKKRFRTARKETETSAQRDNISTHVETIERLQDKIQTMQSDHHRELMKLEAKHQSELNRKEAVHTEETTRLKTSDIFRKAVNNIIRLARNYYKPCFDAEHVSDIKSVLNLFDDNKQPHRTTRDFLYITAKQKGNLDNWERIKAKREADNVVEGDYDQQQKRSFSMRR